MQINEIFTQSICVDDEKVIFLRIFLKFSYKCAKKLRTGTLTLRH